MIANITKELRWKIDLVQRKNNPGFDAKFSFTLESAPKKIIEQLLIQLENGSPYYSWQKNVFPPGIKEYLEYKCQNEMDESLQSLERSELRS